MIVPIRVPKRLVLLLGLGLVALASSCNMTRQLHMPVLAHAQVATDFDIEGHAAAFSSAASSKKDRSAQ